MVSETVLDDGADTKNSRPTLLAAWTRATSLRSIKSPSGFRKRMALSVRNLFHKKVESSTTGEPVVFTNVLPLVTTCIAKEAESTFDDKLKDLMESVSDLATKDRALTETERQSLMTNVQCLTELRKGISTYSHVDRTKQSDTITPDTTDDDSSQEKTVKVSLKLRSRKEGSPSKKPTYVKDDQREISVAPLWSNNSRTSMSDDSSSLIRSSSKDTIDVPLRSPKKSRHNRLTKAVSERITMSPTRSGKGKQHSFAKQKAPEIYIDFSPNSTAARRSPDKTRKQKALSNRFKRAQSEWAVSETNDLSMKTPLGTEQKQKVENPFPRASSEWCLQDSKNNNSSDRLPVELRKTKPQSDQFARTTSVASFNDSGKLRIPSSIVLSPLVNDRAMTNNSGSSSFHIKKKPDCNESLKEDEEKLPDCGAGFPKHFRRAASATCISSAPFCEASPTNHAPKKSVQMSKVNVLSMSAPDVLPGVALGDEVSLATTIASLDSRFRKNTAGSLDADDEMSLASTICSTANMTEKLEVSETKIRSPRRGPNSNSKQFVKQLSARVRASQTAGCTPQLSRSSIRNNIGVPPLSPQKKNMQKSSRIGSLRPTRTSPFAPMHVDKLNKCQDMSPQCPARKISIANGPGRELTLAPSDHVNNKARDVSPQRPARSASIANSSAVEHRCADIFVEPAPRRYRDTSPQRPKRCLSIDHGLPDDIATAISRTNIS